VKYWRDVRACFRSGFFNFLRGEGRKGDTERGEMERGDTGRRNGEGR